MDQGGPESLQGFPDGARDAILDALTIAAEGGHPAVVRPMRGFGSGIYEVAQPCRGDAFRVVYAVQFEDALYVVHTFQKKSKTGIRTPQSETDLIRARLLRLEEERR